jgi:hypothetical protein
LVQSLEVEFSFIAKEILIASNYCLLSEFDMEVLLVSLLESYGVGAAGDIHLLINFFINFKDVIFWAIETWLELL